MSLNGEQFSLEFSGSGFFKVVAGVTGLEPAASCVTGKRSNQLSYTPNLLTSFGLQLVELQNELQQSHCSKAKADGG